jgi:hypothetical protein
MPRTPGRSNVRKARQKRPGFSGVSGPSARGKRQAFSFLPFSLRGNSIKAKTTTCHVEQQSGKENPARC